jgi:uncharacterized OsmC-like protein
MSAECDSRRQSWPQHSSRRSAARGVVRHDVNEDLDADLACNERDRASMPWAEGSTVGGEVGMQIEREIDQLNGIDVRELRDDVASARRDPTVAERNPVVVARWVGGDQAEVLSATGGPAVVIGGDDAPSAMNMLLRSLAACDVDLIANRASLLGVEIETLSVEARGHFNVQRYLGVQSAVAPGYDQVSYTVRLKTKGATSAQIAELRRACEEASPVGDTLQRSVPVSLEFEAS